MTLESKFKGVCCVCEKAYKPGDTIEWMSRGKARHPECQPKQKLTVQSMMIVAFEAMRGAENLDAAIDRAIKVIDFAFKNNEVVVG